MKNNIHQRQNQFINYFRFMNVIDYSFTKWLTNYKMSKDDVYAFFCNFNLQQIYARFNNFHNVKKWRAQIYRILYDIKNDHWRVDKFIIIININDLAITEYIIYYRNVFQMIRFLLDHEFFWKNVNYASIYVKIINDSRVYNEMHTENWW